jgi:hypothetical protein
MTTFDGGFVFAHPKIWAVPKRHDSKDRIKVVEG